MSIDCIYFKVKRVVECLVRNEQWYSWQTGLRLVQAYGRSVRSKDDWATTYVLDSAFGNFVARNKQIIPEWFTAAIR